MTSDLEELRGRLGELGLELDDLTLARLIKAEQRGAPPIEILKEVFTALGMPMVNDEMLEQMIELAGQNESGEAFADAMLIGPCPGCGSPATKNCENEPDIDDLTVGLCTACHRLWCSECGTVLSRAQPSCENPECFLNQPDEEPVTQDSE